MHQRLLMQFSFDSCLIISCAQIVNSILDPIRLEIFVQFFFYSIFNHLVHLNYWGKKNRTIGKKMWHEARGRLDGAQAVYATPRICDCMSEGVHFLCMAERRLLRKPNITVVDWFARNICHKHTLSHWVWATRARSILTPHNKHRTTQWEYIKQNNKNEYKQYGTGKEKEKKYIENTNNFSSNWDQRCPIKW